jgi:4-hydroxythreonine-4-phosphate dehydrogenase
MTSNPPTLAVTPGEPAGIGPECALRLVRQCPELRLVLIADPDLLRATARALSMTLDIQHWREGDPAEPGSVSCLPVRLAHPVQPGQPDPANAPYVLECLRLGARLVQQGHAAALVTGPVQKSVINQAGIAFSGHTEFLAELAGAGRVVMLLVAGSLRVALATTHLPLRAVPDAIDQAGLAAALRIIHRDLRTRFGIQAPRIQVLGLNPHAGEGGYLGQEERTIIQPAIKQARSEGITAIGPVPADTAFTPPALEACDVVLAMYHDQGLPVLKHAGFGHAVNVTLGLPFIRTSVDHGTALDIAGQGAASATSFCEAARLAQRMHLESVR